MKTVLVNGPAFTASGYGEHTRFVLRCLKEHEKQYDIYLRPLNWGKTSWEYKDDEEGQWLRSLANKMSEAPPASFDISIQVTIPDEFERYAKYNIGCTAGIESDKVAAKWIEKCNIMDKVIVVSEHAKYGFDNTELQGQQGPVKINVPMDVVHYPTKEISNEKLDIDFETSFNFLNVGLFGPRKNIENSVKWFVEKFHAEEDVGMIVKTAFGAGSELDRANTEAKLKYILSNYPTRKCKVYLIHGRMSESEMSGLLQHEKVKAMVSLAHGEGYGLPLFEAAYHGLPVIAVGWSGHLDFLMQDDDKKGEKKKKKYFSNVQYDIKPVQKEAYWKGVLEPYSSWAFPKKLSYQQRLEEMVKEHNRLKSRAKKLSDILKEKHKPEKIKKDFMDAMGHVEEVDAVPLLREEAASMKPKERAAFLASKVRELTAQKDKLRLLKDAFKGDSCYVLSCGPTLLDNDQEKLNKLISENVCVSVKQAYDMFKEQTDIHVYNCANFKRYEHEGKMPLTMEASTTPYKLGECDLKFFIRERDFGNSLAIKENYEEWTLEKQPMLRPYGPGIMTESVIFLIEHLGFSEVNTVGYDNKITGDDKQKQHFYTKEGTELNKKDFIHQNDTNSIVPMEKLKEEEKISTDAISVWAKWLQERGCTLKICSSTNPAEKWIERITI